ncbi:MAG TPA: galactokinase [Chitinophagales bacterium]|nr:galactokinase [Chitinophagales bacterium]
MIKPSTLIDEFILHFEHPAETAFFSPGRVNLIGEHIDYNGGLVLPCAISLGITALVRKNNTNTCRIFSVDFNEMIVVDISEQLTINQQKKMHWSDYVTATLRVLQDKNSTLLGADILLASDLPVGSGLSSSAALSCLIAFIFNQKYYEENKVELALDAQTAERNYVGVNCGIMDQFAVSNGKKNTAILLDCATLEAGYIPADFEDYQLVIINSNKSRLLAESKYNERRSECDQALAAIRQYYPATDLCHAPEIALSYIEQDTLYARAKHCLLENQRVIFAAQFLKDKNIEAFGRLLVESHISLEEDYEVSCTELDTIVHLATHFDDCAGARMTGAGFGGCCIALVKKDKIQRFISYVGINYEHKTRLEADFYICAIADGVTETEL